MVKVALDQLLLCSEISRDSTSKDLGIMWRSLRGWLCGDSANRLDGIALAVASCVLHDKLSIVLLDDHRTPGLDK